MTGFFVFIMAIGFLFSQLFNSPEILWVAVVFSLVMNVLSYWF